MIQIKTRDDVNRLLNEWKSNSVHLRLYGYPQDVLISDITFMPFNIMHMQSKYRSLTELKEAMRFQFVQNCLYANYSKWLNFQHIKEYKISRWGTTGNLAGIVHAGVIYVISPPHTKLQQYYDLQSTGGLGTPNIDREISEYVGCMKNCMFNVLRDLEVPHKPINPIIKYFKSL